MNTKLIVALDVKNFEEAKSIVEELSPIVDIFKVGSILYTIEGNKVIEFIHSKGKSVFLDLKFFDIPNTVKDVSFVAANLNVEMFTVHLLGGREMIKASLDGVEEAFSRNKLTKKPLVLGVTVLTSLNNDILKNDLQIGLPVIDMVKHLTEMGYKTGARGFVCSPYEIEILRKQYKDKITLVVPGVRLSGEASGDQKRVMTPKMASELGADYIVMGRSIIGSKDRIAQAQSVLEELGKA